MWINMVDNYGKYVEWGTTGGVSELLLEAVEYGRKYGYTIKSVDSRMGQTYDETILTVIYE